MRVARDKGQIARLCSAQEHKHPSDPRKKLKAKVPSDQRSRRPKHIYKNIAIPN